MDKSVPDKKAEEKPRFERTLGLKLFDVLLYPLITNIGVFAISVGATYLTARGGDKNAAGELIHGKFGEWFQKRGEKLVNWFKGLGMSHAQADMSKMVFFSFADGSLMAPAVKLLEDRREQIGRKLDDMLGTTPVDKGVYEAEPKHSWLSVLGGRFLTAGIVVPTAVALDRTGLNNTLFIDPGKKIGEQLAKKEGVQKWFGKYDVKELAKVSLFEFFYTSVCTLGLYFSSRRIAYFTNQNADEKKEARPQTEPSAVEAASSEREERTVTFAHKEIKKEKPKAAPVSHVERYRHEPAETSYAMGV